MATLELRLNTEGWERGLRRLLDRYPVAIRRSLDRAATSARVVMVREIAKDLGLRQADVADRITTRGAVDGAGDKMSARIVASGARIPLYRFKARQTRTGVTARLPGGSGTYPGAFIATMPTGHIGVFKRKTSKSLPIKERFGPSIPKVFEKFMSLGLQRGQEQLIKNLLHEMKFALSQSAT
jgi:minor tail protein Z (GPZ)